MRIIIEGFLDLSNTNNYNDDLIVVKHLGNNREIIIAGCDIEIEKDMLWYVEESLYGSSTAWARSYNEFLNEIDTEDTEELRLYYRNSIQHVKDWSYLLDIEIGKELITEVFRLGEVVEEYRLSL